jgi:hypothetical protein
MDNFALDDLEKYVARHGSRNATRVMSMLGKKLPFVEAIKSEIGQELLKDAIAKLEILLEKGFENTATDDEKAEYRVLKSIVETWSKRIALYTKGVKKLKNN